ncbi:hypothetical protein CDV31_005986 [Fusarium ambrosium]|uniref:Uncharacterized protein n=1 Tax=Fusarium ambrosium TaxID=131363 RepID=A0A428UGA5_9HYPO|nr:hypothetical protein CDV31_005986 [Fusarium ambrosium]
MIQQHSEFLSANHRDTNPPRQVLDTPAIRENAGTLYAPAPKYALCVRGGVDSPSAGLHDPFKREGFVHRSVFRPTKSVVHSGKLSMETGPTRLIATGPDSLEYSHSGRRAFGSMKEGKFGLSDYVAV